MENKHQSFWISVWIVTGISFLHWSWFFCFFFFFLFVYKPVPLCLVRTNSEIELSVIGRQLLTSFLLFGALGFLSALAPPTGLFYTTLHVLLFKEKKQKYARKKKKSNSFIHVSVCPVDPAHDHTWHLFVFTSIIFSMCILNPASFKATWWFFQYLLG